MCRGIVEAHGGTLEVTSTPGQGATFQITLPVEALSAPQPIPRDKVPTGRGYTILVVDDERSPATGLARLLQRHDHTVDIAEDTYDRRRLPQASPPPRPEAIASRHLRATALLPRHRRHIIQPTGGVSMPRTVLRTVTPREANGGLVDQREAWRECIVVPAFDETVPWALRRGVTNHVDRIRHPVPHP